MNLEKISKELSKPFNPEEIEWRVGATNKDKTMGLALPYITNRAIQNRLDEVFGCIGWKNEFKEWKGNSQLCGISVWDDDKQQWITKWDGAEDTYMESVKGGLSDSMKRAAYQWGIGRYLYKFESVWVPLRDGKYIDVPPSVPEWAIPENYRTKKSFNMEHDSYNKSIDSNISYIKNEANMKINLENDNNKQATTRYNNSNLITEKQINLFNIKSKNKNTEKIIKMLNQYGYSRIEDIEKKDFNGILYYLDRIEGI